MHNEPPHDRACTIMFFMILGVPILMVALVAAILKFDTVCAWLN